MTIIPVEANVFQVEFDNLKESKTVKSMRKIDYGGSSYPVIKVAQGIDAPGCYTFLVFVNRPIG